MQMATLQHLLHRRSGSAVGRIASPPTHAHAALAAAAPSGRSCVPWLHSASTPDACMSAAWYLFVRWFLRLPTVAGAPFAGTRAGRHVGWRAGCALPHAGRGQRLERGVRACLRWEAWAVARRSQALGRVCTWGCPTACMIQGRACICCCWCCGQGPVVSPAWRHCNVPRARAMQLGLPKLGPP